MVLVYLYNSNTRTFKKGRPFFEIELEQDFKVKHVSELMW